jgi:hypothetical protein
MIENIPGSEYINVPAKKKKKNKNKKNGCRTNVNSETRESCTSQHLELRQ